jgi:hypothetical protein
MARSGTFRAEGGCDCGKVRYRLAAEPMFVHCCHCSWCQRESGSAFALNALIETAEVKLLQGQPVASQLPSASGKGQTVLRCPDCGITLWSHYAGAGRAMAFVRVGTLDEPRLCPPDVHIYTSTRLPWVQLPDGVPGFEGYYSARELWPEASRQPFLAMKQAAG